MPQRVLGIDLGSWSVKAVLVESGFRGFKIEGVYEVPLGAVEGEDRSTRQIHALEKLLAGAAIKSDTQVVGFPAELTTTRTVELPYSDAKKVEATVGGELADSLPFDINQAVYDHAVMERGDGGSVSLCAATMTRHVEEQLARLAAISVDPRSLAVDVIQLHTLYELFLSEDASRPEAPSQPVPEASTFVGVSPDAPRDARLIVDIGHERTLVCAAAGGTVAHVRVIRAGGRDVTEAIAQAYGLDWADAEAGKHEDALVASARHPAPSDVAQRMSNVVSQGLKNLVKELRRTLQAIRSEKRVRIARLDLVGGGSRIRNLANYLADQLNVPAASGAAVEQAVERHVEAPRRAAYASALALALRSSAGAAVAHLDLRKGAFSFAGQLQNLRARIPAIAVSAAMLLLLLGVNTVARYRVVMAREAEIDRQFCEITKKVVGREICEPTVAISVVREPASELGTFKIPERSAFEVAAELSTLAPAGVDMRLEEIDIAPDRARVVGEASSFDAVDQLVAAYSQSRCLTDIKKSKLRKKSDGQGVEFQLSIRVACSQ